MNFPVTRCVFLLFAKGVQGVEITENTPIRELHRVRVHEAGERLELRLVAPVERLDAVGHRLAQPLPRELDVVVGQHAPAQLVGVVHRLAPMPAVVYHLLGDAAHVQARAAEAPLGTVTRRLHEGEQRYFGARRGGFLGTRDASGTDVDDEELVVERIDSHLVACCLLRGVICVFLVERARCWRGRWCRGSPEPGIDSTIAGPSAVCPSP